MSADARTQLFAALHVALDKLEARGADPALVAGLVAAVDADARAALAAAGWAAVPLDEAALTARLATLAREATGRTDLRALNPAGAIWMVNGSDRGFGDWCDSELRVWLSVIDGAADAIEASTAPAADPEPLVRGYGELAFAPERRS